MNTTTFIWSEAYGVVVAILVDAKGHPVEPHRVEVFYVPGYEEARNWE